MRLNPLPLAVHAATLVTDLESRLPDGIGPAFRDAVRERVAATCPSLVDGTEAFDDAANALAYMLLNPDGLASDAVAAILASVGNVPAAIADRIGAISQDTDLQSPDDSLYRAPTAPDAATVLRSDPRSIEHVVGTWSADPTDVGTPRVNGLRDTGRRTLVVSRIDRETGERRRVTLPTTYGYGRSLVRDLNDYMAVSGWSHAAGPLLGTETRAFAEVGQTGYRRTDPVTGETYWSGTSDLQDTMGESISAPARRRIEHRDATRLVTSDAPTVKVGNVTYLPSTVSTLCGNGLRDRIAWHPVLNADGTVSQRCTVEHTGASAARNRASRARIAKGKAKRNTATPVKVRSLTSAATVDRYRQAFKGADTHAAFTDGHGNTVRLKGADDGRRVMVTVKVGAKAVTRTVPIGRVRAVIVNAGAAFKV